MNTPTLPVEVLPVFDWDEPEGCVTARGWLHLRNHPDLAMIQRVEGSTCVGNYTEYPQSSVSYQALGNIHASAYLHRYDWEGKQSLVRLGAGWHGGVPEAKTWVETLVREYLGRRV